MIEAALAAISASSLYGYASINPAQFQNTDLGSLAALNGYDEASRREYQRRARIERIKRKHELNPAWRTVVSKFEDRMRVRARMALWYVVAAVAVPLALGAVIAAWMLVGKMVLG